MSKHARPGRKVPGPLLAVAAVVAWNLWSLRSVVLRVAFLNDASVHEMMARYASSVISAIWMASSLPFTTRAMER